MPTSACLLLTACRAKLALDDARDISGLHAAGIALLGFSTLVCIYAIGKRASRPALTAASTILGGLGREFSALAVSLQPAHAHEGDPMPRNQAITKVLQAAYLAEGCIERIHDITSLDTAGHAVLNYSVLLAQTSPAEQKAAREEDPTVPGLKTLVDRYLAAGETLSLAVAS